MKVDTLQITIRTILFVIGFAFLITGMTFIWGLISPWFTSFFIGSALVSFSIALFWIDYFRAYRALIGAGLGAMLSFGGIGIYLLRQQQPYGEYCLYASLLFLWLFFLGLKWRIKKEDWLPLSVQCLFAIILTLALIEGLYLVIPIPSYFVWVLTPEYSVLYGWILMGAALFFSWPLLSPTWEMGYPLLYALLAFDLMILGPFLTLFKEQSEITIIPFFLWASFVTIVGSAIWIIIELCRRFFFLKKAPS